jgi:large subunit ribosomal protein L16
MLQPKKRKYRKEFRGKMGGVSSSNNSIAFGDFGYKVSSNSWVESREIEAARRAINFLYKKKR